MQILSFLIPLLIIILSISNSMPQIEISRGGFDFLKNIGGVEGNIPGNMKGDNQNTGGLYEDDVKAKIHQEGNKSQIKVDIFEEIMNNFVVDNFIIIGEETDMNRLTQMISRSLKSNVNFSTTFTVIDFYHLFHEFKSLGFPPDYTTCHAQQPEKSKFLEGILEFHLKDNKESVFVFLVPATEPSHFARNKVEHMVKVIRLADKHTKLLIFYDEHQRLKNTLILFYDVYIHDFLYRDLYAFDPISKDEAEMYAICKFCRPKTILENPIIQVNKWKRNEGFKNPFQLPPNSQNNFNGKEFRFYAELHPTTLWLKEGSNPCDESLKYKGSMYDDIIMSIKKLKAKLLIIWIDLISGEGLVIHLKDQKLYNFSLLVKLIS